MAVDDSPGLPLADTGTASVPAPRRPGVVRRLRLWRVPLIMAVLFTGAVIGVYFQPPALRAFFGLTGLEVGGGTARPIAVPAPRDTEPPPEAAPAPTGVSALGRLMPQGDVITLAMPYGAGDARVSRLLVAEGDTVAAGDLIAELDSLPQLLRARASAAAALAAREAALRQVEATLAAAGDEAEANRDRAASAAALAAEEAARQQTLFERGVINQAALDRARAAAEQAAAELQRAEVQLARQRGGAHQADIDLAAREVDVARSELDRAAGDLSRAEVRAPRDGTVIALHVQPGERPGARGIATLGDTRRMQAELEVYQTDIARVAPGQPVDLRSPALPAPLTGTVTAIALEVERQTILSGAPAANTDARIVRVTVSLAPESSARAAALTGLEVTGFIRAGGP